MSDTAKVAALLAEHPAWVSASGSFDPIPVGAYTGSDESCAAAIWGFAMGMPYADPVDRVWWSFGGGSHFVSLNTYQALGLQPLDPPSPSMPGARTAEDCVELAKQGWHYSGDAMFLDMSKPESVEEFNRRDEFAKVVPPSWQACDPKLYWYFIVSNRVASQPVPFGVRQNENAASYHGYSLQMFLDNEWAVRDGKPKPWKKGGVPA